MGGLHKTFTLNVTIRGPQYVYSRLKMVTASEATQSLSGHLMVIILVTVNQFCLTCLPIVISQAKRLGRICIAIGHGDLASVSVMS